MDTIALASDNWTARGWSGAADGMAAVTSIMRAQQLLQSRVDAVLAPFSLSFARYEVLMLLVFSRRGSMPISKAGARLQVHPTSVTSAVDRLQDAGLVRRRPNPRDGRSVLVAITPRGRRLALAATDELNAQVFSSPGLSPARTRDLVEVLTRLRADAGDLD